MLFETQLQQHYGSTVLQDRGMCRNIRTLHNFEPPATRDEVYGAALQYVRKVSGSTSPSHVNEEAFARAVEAVTAATHRLLDELVTSAPPKNREVEAAKARERAAARYDTG
jgi:hypothetical protein